MTSSTNPLTSQGQPTFVDGYVLRLYVSAAAPMSSRAVVNTRAFCEKHLANQYQLEILSIADHVALAAQDQVVAAPTLVKLWPLPVRRFVGDMTHVQRVLQVLGIANASSV